MCVYIYINMYIYKDIYIYALFICTEYPKTLIYGYKHTVVHIPLYVKFYMHINSINVFILTV